MLAENHNRPASAQVWRLVSGLPTGKREARTIMVLDPQAFIDDSVTPGGQGFFVLAGFIAPAANWSAFSDEWQAALDLEPKLEYFKANEANALTGQFAESRGWTEAKKNDRLIDFTRVINKYTGLRVFASVKQSLFEKYISHVPLTYRSLASDNPYIYLFTTLLVSTMVRSHRYGINEPCDFIFDNQSGFEEEIFANWQTFQTIAAQAPSPRNLLGDRPQFKNDKCFVPLQAADLYANQARYSLERNAGRIIVPPNVVLQQLLPIPDISIEVSEDVLRDMGATVMRIQQAVLKANPHAPLAHFAATARERRLIRKRARNIAKKLSSSKERSS